MAEQSDAVAEWCTKCMQSLSRSFLAEVSAVLSSIDPYCTYILCVCKQLPPSDSLNQGKLKKPLEAPNHQTVIFIILIPQPQLK
jgi:hypothetical protein